MSLKQAIQRNKMKDLSNGENLRAFVLQIVEDIVVRKFLEIKEDIADEVNKEIEDEIGNRIIRIPAEKGHDGHTPTKEELERIIKPLIPPPKKGDKGDVPILGKDFFLPKDGKTPTENEIKNIIKPLIPEPIPGKNGSPDTPDQVVGKVNIAKKKIAMVAIDGLTEELQGIKRVVRDKGGSEKGGGGMGNVQHESKSVSSSTTSVSTSFAIGGNGYAVWGFYQGQMIVRGTHYTVNSDRKTLPLLFTPQDSTTIDFIYVRG